MCLAHDKCSINATIITNWQMPLGFIGQNFCEKSRENGLSCYTETSGTKAAPQEEEEGPACGDEAAGPGGG